MNNDYEKYSLYLNDLYNFYQKIRNYVFLEFDLKNDKSVFNIDFSNAFVVSNKLQNGFVLYDKNTKKYQLSLYCGIRKYYLLKNRKISSYNNYMKFLENDPLRYFSENKRCLLMQNKKISFVDMIKGEFLHEWISSLIDITGNSTYSFSDSYGFYSDKRGNFYNEIVVELLTRKFASKYNLFYLPLSIGNKKIFSITNRILNSLESKDIIFNYNIEILLSKLNKRYAKRIIEFEEESFEEKYKLNRGSFKNKIEESLLFKENSVKDKKPKNLMSNLTKNIDITDISNG